MNADGSMFKDGWIGDGVNMFYMDTKDGHMLHDLVNIQGKNYYFDANGLMQRGMVAIDGKMYLFGADGSMQYGWYADAAGMRYFAQDGHMLVNTTQTIDGIEYAFDANGLAAAVPVAADINPLAWVIDPVTGITVDSTTGQVVDPVIVEQVLNAARQMQGK